MSQWVAPLEPAMRTEDELECKCAEVWGAERARVNAGRLRMRMYEARKQTAEIVLQILPFAIAEDIKPGPRGLLKSLNRGLSDGER